MSIQLAEELAANDRQLRLSLIAVRESRGLTPENVADFLGWDVLQVYEFEAYYSNPTLATIRRYAYAVQARITTTVEEVR